MEAALLARITWALDEHGYCVVPRLLRPDIAERLRELLDRLRALEPRPDVEELGHHRVLHLPVKHQAFIDLLCHPLALAVSEAYLGADFICSSITANTVVPHADPRYWHVDHPYWAIAQPYPVQPALSWQAIWCLDDYAADNGATEVIPGSHRRPCLPVHDADHSFESRPIEAPLGSLILTHGALWHSMGRNDTDAPRTAVLVKYARSFVIPQEDMQRQLELLGETTPLVRRLFCADQYIPQRGFPY